MQIVMGIQRYLRQQAGKPGISILDRNNSVFSNFRATLDMRINKLDEEKGNKHTSQDQIKNLKGNNLNFLICKEIPFEQNGSLINKKLQNFQINSFNQTIRNDTLVEEKLWDYGLIGDDTAGKLLNAVMYHNYTRLKIITTDDHWNLHLNHFRIISTDNPNTHFIEFDPSASPRLSICNNMEPEKVKTRFPIDPSNHRCVGFIYKKYIELLPSTNGRFYHHIVLPTLVDHSIRLSDQSIGKNRIRTMIKQLNEKVQFLITSLLLRKNDVGHSTMFSSGKNYTDSNKINSLTNQASVYNNQKLTQFIQHQLAQQLLKHQQINMFDKAEEKFKHTNQLNFDDTFSYRLHLDALLNNGVFSKLSNVEDLSPEDDTNLNKSVTRKSSEASINNVINIKKETSIVEDKSEIVTKSICSQSLNSEKNYSDNTSDSACGSGESTLELSIPGGINKIIIRSKGKQKVIDLSDF